MADATGWSAVGRKIHCIKGNGIGKTLIEHKLMKMALNDAISACEAQPAAYVLSSGIRSYFYKGSCRDLVKRLKDHRAGRVSKTKNHRPLSLVLYEYTETYTIARKRENFFKSGAGREYILRKIKEDGDNK